MVNSTRRLISISNKHVWLQPNTISNSPPQFHIFMYSFSETAPAAVEWLHSASRSATWNTEAFIWPGRTWQLTTASIQQNPNPLADLRGVKHRAASGLSWPQILQGGISGQVQRAVENMAGKKVFENKAGHSYGGWTGWPLAVPSNPKRSKILWLYD